MNIRVIGKEDALSKYIKNNLIVYAILLTIFLIGILIGTLYYKNINDEKNLSGYLEDIIDKLVNIQDVDTYDIFKESLIKNIGIAVIFWILGASIIGIPILFGYIAYKGFTLGFIISSFISTFGFWKGNIIGFVMLFFQNLFALFAMTIVMASGIKLAMNILTRRKEMKIELIRHTIVSLFCMIILAFASTVETALNGPALRFVLEKIK